MSKGLSSTEDINFSMGFKLALHIAVNDMPLEHKNTLEYLLNFLVRVTESASENKMPVDNLAIVFAPTLLWPRVALQDQRQVLQVITFIYYA